MTLAAAVRVAAGIWAGSMMPLLGLAGVAWVAAFLIFVGTYGPMLLRSRPVR